MLYNNELMARLVKLNRVSKVYGKGDSALQVLKDISLQVKAGEFLALTGKSGSGKSTLLHLIGVLDKPTSGSVEVAGELISAKAPSNRLAELRRDTIGFIFQNFNLIPQLTACANVELPMIYSRAARRGERAKKLLELVGLGRRMHHKPNQLSGGEQQRVAIARALANDPKLLLADEPTGNLDSKTSYEIMELLAGLHRQGLTIVMVSHEKDIVAYAKRVINLKDGRIVK